MNPLAAEVAPRARSAHAGLVTRTCARGRAFAMVEARAREGGAVGAKKGVDNGVCSRKHVAPGMPFCLINMHAQS